MKKKFNNIRRVIGQLGLVYHLFCFTDKDYDNGTVDFPDAASPDIVHQFFNNCRSFVAESRGNFDILPWDSNKDHGWDCSLQVSNEILSQMEHTVRQNTE